MAEEKLVCFTEDEILKPREIIIELMDFMINRGLTDFSGGNMALRIGDKVYSTQTHSADIYRWKLRPDNILVTDIDQNLLEGRKETMSREANLHFGILKRFPEINCTIHGNTFYSPLLISMGIKVTGVTEVAQYHNIVEMPVVPESIEPLSDKENDTIVSFFEDLKKKGQAFAVIMPLHGIIVGAKDHNTAFALFDAVESNAKFILYREMLKTNMLVNRIFEKLGTNLEKPAQGKTISEGTGSINDKSNGTFELDGKTKILTAEDITDIAQKVSPKTIKTGPYVVITDFALNKADELGIKIIKG
jgi:ribulose-5-phosphate 4-epimerase/fuculose-1-phosphate aldolase